MSEYQIKKHFVESMSNAELHERYGELLEQMDELEAMDELERRGTAMRRWSNASERRFIKRELQDRSVWSGE